MFEYKCIYQPCSHIEKIPIYSGTWVKCPKCGQKSYLVERQVHGFYKARDGTDMEFSIIDSLHVLVRVIGSRAKWGSIPWHVEQFDDDEKEQIVTAIEKARRPVYKPREDPYGQ